MPASRSGRRLEQQDILGGAHHDRRGDEGERDRTGIARKAVEGRDQQFVDEQADEDRRGRKQHVVEEADDRRSA
jgi:hypothetical protein